MSELGKLIPVEDLRSVWEHEANDFSAWLYDNIGLLNEALDLEIDLIERESNIGKFNVDLYGQEVGTGKKVIIENQLEDTDHDHLGKIITYASGKDASYIIWIVKRARDEHKNAVEWLNSHTDSNTHFFLLEIELWKIGDSVPAPKFNIVVSPNDWAKEMKILGESSTEIGTIQRDFWAQFKEYNKIKDLLKYNLHLRTPRQQHWYDISIGTSCAHISLIISVKYNTLKAGIYIKNDMDLYDKFYNNKNEIAEYLECEIAWNKGKKDSTFYTSINIDTVDDDREKYFEWLGNMANRLYDIFQKFK